MVGPVISVLQCDGHQSLPVLFGAADQRATGSHGIAGFQSDAPIHILQKLIMVGHGPSADGDGFRRGDADQRLVIHRRTGQRGHVPGGGIVVRVIQAVGVCKRGV